MDSGSLCLVSSYELSFNVCLFPFRYFPRISLLPLYSIGPKRAVIVLDLPRHLWTLNYILGTDNGEHLLHSIPSKWTVGGALTSATTSVLAGHTDKYRPSRAAPHTSLANIYTHRHNFSVHCATIIVFGLFTAKALALVKALDTQQKKEWEH